MRIRVLGSCAGGGLPQWNCGFENAVRARRGDPAVPPRTQPGLAVSADGVRWSLLNASPDLRLQLAAFPGLHPRPGTRDVPLDSVVLTSAELDHVLGLLVLREALSYRIVSTAWVRDQLLSRNAAFRLLEPAWGTARLDEPLALDREGALEARLFPVPGKVPGHLAKGANGGKGARREAETVVGVRLTDRRTGRRMAFVPGARELDSGTRAELEAADLRFVDGTFFTPDELRRMRPGAPDSAAMGHVPITGPGGSLEVLEKLPGRSFYFHVNGTNPILASDSKEASLLRAAGVEVAMDGQEIEL